MTTVRPAQPAVPERPSSDVSVTSDETLALIKFGDEIQYWTRYLFVSIVVLGVESLGSLGYLLLSPSGPHRAFLEVIAATVAAATLAMLPSVPRIAQQSWRSTFALILALGAGVIIAFCSSLDGGLDSSPLLFLLALPVANLAIAFPPRMVALSATAALIEFATVATFDHDVTTSLAVVVLLTVFLMGIITLALGWSFAQSDFDSQKRAMFKESVRQAKTDALTGCLNHGAFFERLQSEIERALRYGGPLSILVADVDVFKAFNDRYGHPAGDDALRIVGATMTRTLRAIDVVGRIGGDEFAVILPATDLPGARVAATKLVETLRNPEGVDFTVSVGFASLDRSEPLAKRLFHDADAGLYRAKVTGRVRASGLARGEPGVRRSKRDEHSSSRVWAAADTRRFEEAVREARIETSETNAFLDALASSSSMGMAFIDTDFRIVRINPTLAALIGGTVEQFVGKISVEAAPALWPAFEPSYRKVFETGEPVVAEEVSLERPDEPGVSETWLSTIFPVTANGVRTGLCVTAIDITARKQLERSQATLADSLVRALAAAAEMRDPYIGGHQERVAHIAVAIARELRIDPDEIKDIEMAAKIHDVGKLAVPAEVLSRPGRLSDAEMALVREHSRAGSDMLERVGFPDAVRLMVLQHHERLDGSGYPDALKGDEVFMGSRIIAVADVLEAMSSHRPYRAAPGVEAAITEIQEGSGTLYDPDAVNTCVRLVREGLLRQHISD
ncbi:MAG TPA: HD domain-containing phosphohydrolase [Acidimicrobiales bacterium]|nr:HD domain-containing phosphohydrolase [Acidimicrobiales bacterium]